MTIQDKTYILSLFFINIRREDCAHLDILLELDDLWQAIYQENRIKVSFEDAKVLSNEVILKTVLDHKFKVENALTYHKHCGLSKEEWNMEQLIDKIKNTPSTLDCMKFMFNELKNLILDSGEQQLISMNEFGKKCFYAAKNNPKYSSYSDYLNSMNSDMTRRILRHVIDYKCACEKIEGQCANILCENFYSK